MAVRGADVTKLMEIAVAQWAGRREEKVRELFDRLFAKRIAGMVYPEAREIVKAHLRAGHTVALASSATRYQLAALAEDLRIEHVLCSEVEVVRGIFSELPTEERDRLPADLAENLDHYIYGTEKKQP